MAGEDEKKPDSSAPLAVTKPSSGLADAEAVALATAASALLGFPLPPTIARSLIASVGALVTSAIDVPTAYLQTVAQRIRAEGDARASFTKSAVPIATKTLAEDASLADRATRFLGHRMLREQHSRETIAQGALEDLKADPPKEDAPKEVDEDWLHMFARLAETKTNSDVQAYFSRVLAGEIRKPGSFAPETIEVLARVTPEVGRLFQDFCGLTIEFHWTTMAPALFTEPFGEAGNNALAPLGFSYDVISRLQDAGLVRTDLSAYYTLPLGVFLGCSVGGQSFSLGPSDPTTMQELMTGGRQLKVVRLTSAGTELRRIVHMTPNELYLARLTEWALKNRMVRPPT